MEIYRHYRKMLNSAEREAYRAIEVGMTNVKSEFSVPKLEAGRLSDIVTMLRLDNPWLFHFRSFRTVSVSQASSVTIKMDYTMKKAQYEETRLTVKKRLDKLLAPCADMNDDERELFIHDYIVKNVVYERAERPYSHEVTGPLCHGIGVCEGIAKVFKLMCDETDIPCFVVIGIGVPPECKTGKKSELHAWNTVCLDNIPYGVDATFDLSLSTGKGGVCYNYYNVPDSVMMCDHSDVRFSVVPCRHVYKELYKYRKIRKYKEKDKNA